jgi:hypothetical protein
MIVGHSPRVHIKLTQERDEITPHGWAHPDEDR